MHRKSQLCNLAGVLTMLGVLLGLAIGCETKAQTGALGGAGIGALAGQAIGGDTKATLIGAAVGTGVGYIIGNEADKQKAREMSNRTVGADYAHDETGLLQGSRWRVVTLVPESFTRPFASKIVEFREKGYVWTTTTNEHGTESTVIERYRVVGDTLIVNRPGFLINARFRVDGDQLKLSAEDFRAVLQRVQ